MFQAPFLDYGTVRKAANKFLEEHHCSSTIPVPIEEIADVQLGLDIIPFPSLYMNHHQNGFLSSDRMAIFVDELQYKQYEEKLRFTIAHEIGHYVLHEECYAELQFSNPSEYVSWRLSVSPNEIDWFENQANWFAGCVLVPPTHLKTLCLTVIKETAHRLIDRGFRTLPESYWSYAAIQIADRFGVSSMVVDKQITKENIAADIGPLESYT